MLEQALELESFSDLGYGLAAGPGGFEGMRPFDVWLASQVLGDDSWADDTTGTVEWNAWYALVGRRIVSQDDRGFVYVAKYRDVDHARDVFAALAENYAEWCSDDESEVME